MRFSFDPVIACELAPNYQLDDAIRAGYAMCAPYPIAFHTPQQEVRQWMTTYLTGFAEESPHSMWLVDSGRTALYLLLSQFNFPSSSEAMLLGYSCIVVPNAIIQAGIKPVLVDVDPRTYNFDLADVQKKISTKTRVIIVQHTYGIMENMEEIMKLARKHNLIVIEDCAHSLGSSQMYKKEQKNAGSIGHAAIFSFGRDKAVSSTVGGAAVINHAVFADTPKTRRSKLVDDKQWAKEAEKAFQKLPNMSLFLTMQSLLYPIITTIFVRPLYSLNIGKLILLFSQKMHLISDVYRPQERDGASTFLGGSKYSSRLAFVLLNQLKKFPRFVLHRDSLAQLYAKKFDAEYIPGTMYLRYPLKLREAQKYVLQQATGKKRVAADKRLNKEIWTSLKGFLQHKSILMGTWYTSIFQPWKPVLSKRYRIKKGDLPQSCALTDYEVINLPTHINTTEVQGDTVVAHIKDFLKDRQ